MQFLLFSYGFVLLVV